MKKLLLIAATALIALGASAEGYKIEKVWSLNALSYFPTINDSRQGFGMDGKFYIHNKADQTVYVLDQNGLTNQTYVGGANCGISHDEAGNILVSNATFPNNWVEEKPYLAIGMTCFCCVHSRNRSSVSSHFLKTGY